MASFDTAVAKTLDHEGGYTSGLPIDPGGETNFGISKRAHPGLDIKSLTREAAIAIYRHEYWFPEVEGLDDQRLANSAFDFGVNAGVEVARVYLRRALRITGADEQLREFTVLRILYYSRLAEWHALCHVWIERSLDY